MRSYDLSSGASRTACDSLCCLWTLVAVVAACYRAQQAQPATPRDRILPVHNADLSVDADCGQSLHRGGGTWDRHAAEEPAGHAADRPHVLEIEVDIEHLLDVVDGHPHVHASPPVVQRLDAGRLAVVLIGDLTDDLFEDVL